MAEVTKMGWDEVAEMADIDETISEQDQKDSDNIGFENMPVGMFLVEVVESCGVEAVLTKYTCIAANLKLSIQAIIEIEQEVKDQNGKIVERDGEPLMKRLPVKPEDVEKFNEKYLGTTCLEDVYLFHPSEKAAVKNRRLFIAKRLGIINPTATEITAKNWAKALHKKVVITTGWNHYIDKQTDEKKKNVQIEWDGWEFASNFPDVTGVPSATGSGDNNSGSDGVSDEDFNGI